VAFAEDGNPCHYRPSATLTEPADAVDDAAVVWLSSYELSQWSGAILGDVKCYQYLYPVLCSWGVGWPG
jgi:hypothetical protein